MPKPVGRRDISCEHILAASLHTSTMRRSMKCCKGCPRRQLDEVKDHLARSLVCFSILFLSFTIYLSPAAATSTHIFLASVSDAALEIKAMLVSHSAADNTIRSGKQGKVSVNSQYPPDSKVSSDQTFGWISRPDPRQKAAKRWLSGLGSSPPTCVSKCAKCTPCNAVRVPIQPGRKAVGLMEYYPEAWRCQCKNKLYMP